MINKYIKNAIYYIVGILLIALIFQIIAWVKSNDYFFPNVNDIVGSFFNELGRGKTWIGILNSSVNVILTILFSFAVALIFAVFAYKFSVVYKILKPLMMIFRFIPIVIIIDILFYMFYRQNALILYVTVSTFLVPIVYEAIYQGINSIDKSYIDVYRLSSSFNLRILFKVYLPLAASACKSAFLNAIGIGIKICLSVEFLCSFRDTLGFLIKVEISNYDGYTDLYGYLIILIILSVILEAIPLIVMFIYNKIKYRERKIELEY